MIKYLNLISDDFQKWQNGSNFEENRKLHLDPGIGSFVTFYFDKLIGCFIAPIKVETREAKELELSFW